MSYKISYDRYRLLKREGILILVLGSQVGGWQSLTAEYQRGWVDLTDDKIVTITIKDQ